MCFGVVLPAFFREAAGVARPQPVVWQVFVQEFVHLNAFDGEQRAYADSKKCYQVQVVQLVLVVPVQNGKSVLKDPEDQKAAKKLEASDEDAFFALTE